MKYAFIQQHSREFCIPRLCQALGVARSSYYEWLERQSNYRQREQRQASLDTQVAAAFQSKKGCYGAWRLCKLLAKDGQHYNRHRLHSTLGYLSPLDFEAQFLTS